MSLLTLQSKLRRASSLQNSWQAEVYYRIVSRRLTSPLRVLAGEPSAQKLNE